MTEREVIQEGPSVAEAIDAALERLGVQQDAVRYEVLDEGAHRVIGHDRPAKVRVWLKDPVPVSESHDAEVPGDVVEDQGDELELSPEDEELDALADTASDVITRVLGFIGMSAEIEEYEGDEGELILDVVGSDDLGVLIGRHGRTLDALHVLVAAIAHRVSEVRHPLMVDVSGYRYRQRMKIEEIAKRAAERVARTGRPVTLRPMSAFERKAVHVALRDDKRVTTASEGDEPARQVVISPR
ncbi:Jag N-terminal domain-containing protein [Coriobacteriia bacterium Es71-Z0120]|uniref:RNA-binding cell elongation regulator Jag/EloR n=1 Tax=Parvivirga hydrogeniphila TaxID=2939460 RepID=UPI002260B0DB|nr:RNA-binding cell elongation regulator Jag/EloR [Parvivirga hydrogeniphila]MCL4078184.1 Jag N-terminal domain-containing protein [Parvivirga hydrogeniphila]